MPLRYSQRGFSLVVVLLMLVALSLLGAMSYAIVTSSSRSAATWNDRQRSLYLTESALKLAETEIKTLASGETGVFPPTNLDYFKTRKAIGSVLPFPTSGIKSVYVESANNRIASGKVNYFIVYEGKVNNKDRVTVYAQSAGARSDTNSVVSATYEVQN